MVADDAVSVIERTGDGARVHVERGEVLVRWSDGQRTLFAGEDGLFEPPPPAAAPPTRSPPARVDSPPAVAPTGASGATVEELLVAADVARLSNRPREAVGNLRRALALDPDPSREAVAAFTLGKVLLEELAEAEPAAEAFARARAAEPRGPLAEDALAREVEAWSRAGAAALARLRARDYLRLFPSGRRAREVRGFGGLGD